MESQEKIKVGDVEMFYIAALMFLVWQEADTEVIQDAMATPSTPQR